MSIDWLCAITSDSWWVSRCHCSSTSTGALASIVARWGVYNKNLLFLLFSITTNLVSNQIILSYLEMAKMIFTLFFLENIKHLFQYQEYSRISCSERWKTISLRPLDYIEGMLCQATSLDTKPSYNHDYLQGYSLLVINQKGFNVILAWTIMNSSRLSRMFN